MARARVQPGRVSRLALRVAFVGLVSALTLGSRAARADEPAAPEVDTSPSVVPPSSARPNLVLVGAAITVGWYGAAVGVSYLWSDSDGASALRIPVAGPYMALAKTGCSDREIDCGTFTIVLRTILTSLSAVGQTGGVLAMLEGAFVPTSSGPSRDRAGVKTEGRAVQMARTRGASPHVGVISTGSAGLGLGVFGNF